MAFRPFRDRGVEYAITCTKVCFVYRKHVRTERYVSRQNEWFNGELNLDDR